MKKVLAIAPYGYLPFFSGGQKFIALFLQYLGKEVDLAVISVANNDLSRARNYKPLFWMKETFFRYINPGLPFKIISLIKKEKYDTIIWEHPYYAWAAYFVKKRTGIKTVIHSHNIEYQRFRSLGKWWWVILKTYEKWFFGFADFIFFITPEDKQFAIDQWKIPAKKCIDVPFGIEQTQYPGDRQYCNELIKSRHGIKQNEKIILFNGALDYKPNLDALKIILEKINPLLLLQTDFKYKILICGRNLPEDLNYLKDYENKNILYAGFVDDIETYFKAADLFLNPVQSGGGIKTKMVEAIGFGTTVISTKSGAIGLNNAVCDEKLSTCEDDDWEEFTKIVKESINTFTITPNEYYLYYSWPAIMQNLKSSVN